MRRLNAADQVRVDDHIVGLADEPRPPGCTKLKGRDDQYRIRVGGYRIVYTVDDTSEVVTILAVGGRGDVYDR